MNPESQTMHSVSGPTGTTAGASRRSRLTVAVSTLVFGLILMAMKFWAYQKTASQAVLSDALESLVNIMAATLGIYVIWLADKPADEDHPYGHGKIEYFSGAVEGGLILFAAMMIFGEAVHAVVTGQTPHSLSSGVLWMGVAGAANGLMGAGLVVLGKRWHSLALRSSGHHLLSDFVTSLIVVLGLFVMERTGYLWLDPILAILASLYLGWTGARLVHEASGGLMDREDVDVLKELREIFLRHLSSGIIQLHHVRVIRAGRFHHVDAHMIVPEFWDVKQTFQTVKQFEERVLADYRHDGEMHVHVDPCQRQFCAWCDLDACPIRQAPFSERRPLSLDELRSQWEPERQRNA